MEEWKTLEFSYAKRLKECPASERRQLYQEAYSAVASAHRFSSDRAEERTAGTSEELVRLLSRLVRRTDDVLEVGCGRGYTCMMLAPHVRSIVGTDVSDGTVAETRALLTSRHLTNASARKVSAVELAEQFESATFDACISIDVIEHLHPDDAKEHMRQVARILRHGGRYIVVSPSRLNGPHDVTAVEFPDAREALGFHLNETTFAQLSGVMRGAGFTKFSAFYPLRTRRGPRPLVLPYQVSLVAERFYDRRFGGEVLCSRVFQRFISIRLIARKP